LATVIGDMCPLIAEAASEHTHTTGQWDLHPLPKALLERRWNEEHVHVIDVQLVVEAVWN
jgi:hypothetical protein